MLNYRLLQQLAPLNFRDERKTETLADYLDRVSPGALHSLNVLAQWIYRHWRGFESNWSFIDLASHQFECEHWPTAQIIEQIDSRHMEVIDRWGEMLRSNRYVRRSWLGDDMLRRGTWSEPVIVLATAREPATRTVTPAPSLLPAGGAPQARLSAQHGRRWRSLAGAARTLDLSTRSRHLNVFPAKSCL
jgi:hypothetical protein